MSNGLNENTNNDLFENPKVDEVIERHPTHNKHSNHNNTEPTSTKNDKQNNSYLIIFLISCIIILLIALIVYYFMNTSKNETIESLRDIEEKYANLDEENSKLHSEIVRLNADNQNYVNHINRLADELEAKQHKNPYSSVIPMTENSYDAPNPDDTPTKPQVVKDKEAIKVMVNRKRQTVQDVIDEQKREKENNNKQIDDSTEKELKDLTQIENDEVDNDEIGHSDEADEKSVNELMNIIQNQ